jgi:uncharacterized protein
MLKKLMSACILLMTALPLHAAQPPASPASASASVDVVKTVIDEQGLVAELFVPQGAKKTPGMLVIGGSEGGIDSARRWGEPLAQRGYSVLSLAYFGAGKLPAQLEEIPLEYFKKAIDYLAAQPGVDPQRIGLLGASKGGEAALLIAAHYPQIKLVVAGVPSHVVWQSINFQTWALTSSWTLDGKPLAFVPYDNSKMFDGNIRSIYERSLLAEKPQVDAAIAVERINGPVLLISAGEDKIWPSAEMAEHVMARLKASKFRFSYEHLTYPKAGHAILGTPVQADDPRAAKLSQLGGTVQDNVAARNETWEKTLSFLDRSLKH